jgi:hypothetical protein
MFQYNACDRRHKTYAKSQYKIQKKIIVQYDVYNTISQYKIINFYDDKFDSLVIIKILLDIIHLGLMIQHFIYKWNYVNLHLEII